MTIALSANTPRISYTVNQGATQTSFAVPFVFFTGSTDLNVFVDGTERTFDASTSNTTLYTVSGGSGSTGTVTTSVTGATGGSTVVITRDIPLSRTTDFPSSGAFEISKLNTELDTIVTLIADADDENSRALRLKESDVAVDLTLPLKADRLGTVLGFNATTGAAEAGPTIANVNALSAITANINTVAGISANVTTVAGISSNVTTVAGIASNVTSVAGNATNINAAVSNATNINTVAGNNTNINTVAGISSDVTSVAGISSNVTTVAGKASLITSDFASGMSLVTSDFVSDVNALAVTDVINDINTLATSDIVSDLNTLATSDIVSDLNTLATSDIVSDLNTLATTDIVADINLLATNDVVGDLALLATSDFVSDLNTIATSTNVTNIATVASNVSSINNFDARYRVASSDPTTSLDVGDLYFNTSDNELRTYNGSAWQTTAVSPALQNNINIVAGEITAQEDLGNITDAVSTSTGNNIETVGDNISSVNTVAGAVTNVNSVATNISSINSVAASVGGSVTYAVTVANVGGVNIFLLDGVNYPTLTLTRGFTYVFDQSDSSNAGHPLAFKNGSSSYTTGVTVTGTAGQAGAKVTFVVPSDAPATGLRYYCTVHGNAMGNTITTQQNDIAIVVANIGDVNGFAARYRIASSEPTSSLDEGDLYYNTTTNRLNFYNGSSFEAIVAGALTNVVDDTTPQLGGNLDINGNSIVSASNGDITIAPNGSGEINLNGTVNTDNLTMDFGSIA